MKRKTWIAALAALLAACLLTTAAFAEKTVEHTTDAEGHSITIVTDENGNQTVITDVEPGDDDITFDEDDFDLDEAEGPLESAEPESAAASRGSVLSWILPLAAAVCAAAVWMLLRRRSRRG